LEITLLDIIVALVIIVLIGSVVAVLFMNMTPIVAYLAKLGNTTHLASTLWNENYVMGVITMGVIIVVIAIIILLYVIPFFIRRG